MQIERPAISLLLALLLAACARTPAARTEPPRPFTSQWDQVAIEYRLLNVNDDFLDKPPLQDLEHDPARITLHALDKMQLDALIQAVQDDPRTVTVSAPRITRKLPAATTLNIDMLPLDLAIRERPDGQLELIVMEIRRSADQLLRQQGFVRDSDRRTRIPEPPILIPAGTPCQITLPNEGMAVLLGIRAPDSNPVNSRSLVILLRLKAFTSKEIENDLFGPGYDKPTGPTTTRPAN